MEEIKKKADFGWLWKIGFILLLGILLGLFLSKNVLAFDNFKWQI